MKYNRDKKIFFSILFKMLEMCDNDILHSISFILLNYDYILNVIQSVIYQNNEFKIVYV